MTTAERQTLSRELIAATALRITDEDGLSGLSMRKLGAALGVEAMSLYHYIENKDDLLDAVLDRLYAEIELPAMKMTDDWELVVRQTLHSLHDVLLRHPASLELFSTRPAHSVASIRVLQWSYRGFESLGLTPAQSVAAFRSVVSFVMGHAGMELGVLAQMQEGQGVDINALSDPELQEFVRYNREMAGAEMFDAGLDVLVSGLRATFRLP